MLVVGVRKIDIIKRLYGDISLSLDRTFKYRNQEFTAWKVNGFETVEQLERCFSNKQILSIYESGE